MKKFPQRCIVIPEIMGSQALLLPHFPELVIAAVGNDFIVEQIPEWLTHCFGFSGGKIVGKPVDEVLSAFGADFYELLKHILINRKPVYDFSLMLEDPNGQHHKITLDAQIKSRQDSSIDRIVISLREIPPDFLDRASSSGITPCGISGKRALTAQITDKSYFGIVGMSNCILRVINKVKMYSSVSAPVLITGESGSGKEVVARAVHYSGKRAAESFIAVNCSAITETLFESELFGHERGSFTGAVRSHKGRFERAHNGTLFLDEIGDMPLPLQAKLLRVIEDETIEKVGSEKSFKVDVRILAATNKNLEEESALKNFRADLFYRINALHINIPPLREHIEDLELLILHFIEKLNRKYDRNVVCLTREAIDFLKGYTWPGNIRELRNLLERLFAENQTEVIGLRALKDWYEERKAAAATLSGSASRVTILPYRPAIPLGMEHKGEKTKPAITEESIKNAFTACGGNITKAARMLGIHKATFYRHLKALNLTRQNLGSDRM